MLATMTVVWLTVCPTVYVPAVTSHQLCRVIVLDFLNTMLPMITSNTIFSRVHYY